MSPPSGPQMLTLSLDSLDENMRTLGPVKRRREMHRGRFKSV